VDQGIEDRIAAAPPREGSLYRAALGFSGLTAGMLCMFGLFFVKIPEGNKEAVLLAIGIVLGWGSTIITYEFGSSPAGRKAADVGLTAMTNSQTADADAADVVRAQKAETDSREQNG
jgi:hypothetical protein